MYCIFAGCDDPIIFSDFGYFLAAIAISLLPIFFLLELRRQYKREKSLLKALKKSFQPVPDFGPMKGDIRRQYLELLQGKAGGGGDGGEVSDRSLPSDASVVDMS